MRDKKDAKVFIRKIDTAHPTNIRVLMPPKIYEFLNQPDKIQFSIRSGQVVITKVPPKRGRPVGS